MAKAFKFKTEEEVSFSAPETNSRTLILHTKFCGLYVSTQLEPEEWGKLAEMAAERAGRTLLPAGAAGFEPVREVAHA